MYFAWMSHPDFMLLTPQHTVIAGQLTLLPTVQTVPAGGLKWPDHSRTDC